MADLLTLGQPTVTRGSHVEPDAEGQWLADMAPIGGPVLGPYRLRADALAAETAWLSENWEQVQRHTKADRSES